MRANEAKPTTIWEACRSISAIDPDAFGTVRRDDGVSLEFPETIVSLIRRIVGFYKRIELEDIVVMPPGHVQVFSGQIAKVQNTFQRILTLEHTDVANHLDALRNVYHETRKALAPFVRGDAMDTARYENEIQTVLRQAHSAKTEVAGIKKGAEDALGAVQALAAEAGVSTHAAHFRKAAARYEESKGNWFLGLVALLPMAAIGTGVWMVLERPPAGADMAAAVHMMAGRFFVFGIVSYAILWVGRGYRAAAHNQVVNEHRRDALATFQTFGEAASDSATRDIVLTQATQCIFSHRPSGFGQHENDTLPPSHMLELTRGAMGGRDDG